MLNAGGAHTIVELCATTHPNRQYKAGKGCTLQLHSVFLVGVFPAIPKDTGMQQLGLNTEKMSRRSSQASCDWLLTRIYPVNSVLQPFFYNKTEENIFLLLKIEVKLGSFCAFAHLHSLHQWGVYVLPVRQA